MCLRRHNLLVTKKYIEIKKNNLTNIPLHIHILNFFVFQLNYSYTFERLMILTFFFLKYMYIQHVNAMQMSIMLR